MIQLRRSALASITLFLAVWSNWSHGQISSLDEPVSIAGEWQFRVGDDPSWASPALDDSDWTTVAVPAHSPDGYPGFTGLAWYRLTVQLQPTLTDSDDLNSLAVMIGEIESAYELYAGGQRLGGVGELPPSASPRYNQHAVYRVPRSAVNPQGQLVLALRVWRIERVPFNIPSGAYAGPFLLGDSLDLNRFAVTRSLVPDMLMATLYLAIGLYHLFIARRNPAMREFFWFGWFAVALAFYSMETSQWRFNINLPFLWHLKIEYTVLYVLPVFAMEVMRRIVRIGMTPVMRLFRAAFLLFALIVAVVPVIHVHYLTLPYFQYLAAMWALYTAILMGRHAAIGNREALALCVLLLVLLLSVVNDLFLSGALLGTANTIYIVFAMTILLMAVLMANHYTATLATLEQSVEERTADLVYAALKTGFRAVDTAAQPKHYDERGVGEGIGRAICEGIVNRKDLFVGGHSPYKAAPRG